jgi:lipopolysaccharide/colanic/teichoic acid biosynthesis glycosyltransferase
MFRSDASGAPRSTAPVTVQLAASAHAEPLPNNPWRASRLQQGLKRAIAIAISTVLLCMLSPMLLSIALCVACSVGFPVIYRQRRVGRNGKSFLFFKYRSMRHGADRALEKHLRSSAAAQSEWDAFRTSPPIRA